MQMPASRADEAELLDLRTLAPWTTFFCYLGLPYPDNFIPRGYYWAL